MLSAELLTEYASKFFGFGNWEAKVWFIGIEEAGGWTEQDVRKRLNSWKQGEGRDLENAPTFYPACGNARWHGEGAVAQETWKKLILMFLVARRAAADEAAILDYQCNRWGAVEGNECLAEILPLPSPNTTTWNYGRWSHLPWLNSRETYEKHVLRERVVSIQGKIEEFRPEIIIFYASTWYRVWAEIARGVWSQAIQGKLMGIDRNGISFYVTRHPRAESDDYFREIGEFLRNKHGNQR